MNYTEPFMRKVETAQEEQQPQHQHHQSGVIYRAAVAAKKTSLKFKNNTKKIKKKIKSFTIELKSGYCLLT